MSQLYPSKVLISGGKEHGGVASFAEALRMGFSQLGIPAEVIPASRIFSRWRDLRDPHVLKILSTTAVFSAPLAHRTICVAHGFPRADVQGWAKLAGILLSYKLAGRHSRLVAVSQYAAVHLRTIFNVHIDAVIHNPLNEIFLSPGINHSSQQRECITYAGRLHPSKGLDRVFPALCDSIRKTSGLRGVIIGDGELRATLEAAAPPDLPITFTGPLPQSEVRTWLRRTRVFVSGCETEALGIGYLEALSQGCTVVMPACGGGVEIAPQQIGKAIHLYSGSGSEPVTCAIRNALLTPPTTVSFMAYMPRVVARAYLSTDTCASTGRTSSQRPLMSNSPTEV